MDGQVGFESQPLTDSVLVTIKPGERVFADETNLPTLACEIRQAAKAWLWYKRVTIGRSVASAPGDRLS